MRQDVEFDAKGTTLRGWLFTPDQGGGPFPTVIATHGFGATKEMYVDRYAEAFADAGIACLLYDHRNFGASDGEPRQEVDPWAQAEDYRDAITFASTREECDAERIGLFGTSYSGGHVLVVAAADKRVKCVYAQVPAISGGTGSSRFIRSDAVAEVRAMFDQDRLARFAGEAPAVVPMISDDPAAMVALPDRETYDWYQTIEPERLEGWRNEVTVRSIEMLWGYEPGFFIHKVSPAPLMMVVMSGDVLAHADLAFAAYERALEPKKLVSLPGGHFSVYNEHFEKTLELSTGWFAEHLQGAPTLTRA